MTVKKHLVSWICLCLALFLACPAAVAEADTDLRTDSQRNLRWELYAK